MKLNVTVHTDIDTREILASRGLGANHAAEKFMAGVVRAFCDLYVPMREGILKNTAEVVDMGANVYLVYPSPYAHYQYAGEVWGPNIPIYDKATGVLTGFYSPPVKHPTGRELTYSDSPMRGKLWDVRMMADRGDEVGKAVADYVGGVYR